MWVYLANLGLSGMAMEAEYTITMPQSNKATTTQTSGWSNPRTGATTLVEAKEPRPPRRTGKAVVRGAILAENQPPIEPEMDCAHAVMQGPPCPRPC